MTDDKAAAYTTLYTVLVTVAKLTAPYTPFMSEMMYQNLVPNFYSDAPMSVHLCGFPVCDESMIDSALEKGMEDVLSVVVLGRAARNAGNLKNRQPLSELVVASEKALDIHDELKAVVLDELNVKNYREVASAGELVSYSLKPQLKTLGPKYGKKLKAISAFLASCNGAEVVAAVKGGGAYNVELEGENVVLFEEDLQIFTQAAEGYVSATEQGVTVALNTALTPELIAEGTEREIVSKIQTMRKEAGFEVTDRIAVYYQAEGLAKEALSRGAFKADVLAEEVKEGTAEGYTKSQDINGDKVTLTLIKK